jgi:hypothetical protein
MKKTLLMLAAVAGLAGATTLSTGLLSCGAGGSVAGANGAPSFGTALLTCDQFNALPVGDTLVSVTISLEDSFNQGNPATAINAFDFTYTSIDADLFLPLGTAPNTCVAGVGGQTNACLDEVTGVGGGSAFYQLGDVITTFTNENYVGAGTFVVADVSGSVDSSNPFSSLTASGQLGTTAFVTFTYSTPTIIGSAPEPGSMLLLGGGLLVAGLIGRKKLVRK